MNYFNSILLVDDDEAINFYHKIMLEEWAVTDKVHTCQHGAQALDYLQEKGQFCTERPSLILLDVNMPVMNGFEFLAEYAKLPPSQKASKVIVMLTTSLHNTDVEKAEMYSDLSGYFNKPLTFEQLETIMK